MRETLPHEPSTEIDAAPRSTRRRSRARRLLALAALLAAGAVLLAARTPAGSLGASTRGDTARSQPAPTVGIRVLRLVDPSRSIRLPGGRRIARPLTTYVRYPALVDTGGTDVRNASPAHGPLPLVVFVHGFAVTPTIYASLLQSWARAGFVVASPVFPLESANAPGGPDEADLVNEPADVSFVISQLLAPSDALAPSIDAGHIAVAGQSDGGEAALAAAYSRRLRDRRIGAAVVLSGARMSGIGGYAFDAGSPPLLAMQGTADPINEPRYTYAYFKQAHRPKFLLRLLGAEHLPPYIRQQPQLSIVERVSAAFLDAYLKPGSDALAMLAPLGDMPGLAALTAEP